MPKPNKKRLLRSQAVELLSAGAQILATSKKLGVNESTLHRWLKDPEFKAEIAKAKQGAMPVDTQTTSGAPIIEQFEKQLNPLAAEMLLIAKDRSRPMNMRIAASNEYRNLLKHIRATSINQPSEELSEKKNVRKISEHKGDPRGILRAVGGTT